LDEIDTIAAETDSHCGDQADEVMECQDDQIISQQTFMPEEVKKNPYSVDQPSREIIKQ